MYFPLSRHRVLVTNLVYPHSLHSNPSSRVRDYDWPSLHRSPLTLPCLSLWPRLFSVSSALALSVLPQPLPYTCLPSIRGGHRQSPPDRPPWPYFQDKLYLPLATLDMAKAMTNSADGSMRTADSGCPNLAMGSHTSSAARVIGRGKFLLVCIFLYFFAF